MQGQEILQAIEAAGEAELARLQRETEARVEAIRREARQEAEARRKAAKQETLQPAIARRTRRLHRARIEALKIKFAARQRVLEDVLAQTRRRLSDLRDKARYGDVLPRLLEEAVKSLGAEEWDRAREGDGPVVLKIDPRDEGRVKECLEELENEPAIRPELETWGGVVLRSGDGRIVVDNTLESRLKRAVPRLREELERYLSADGAAQPGGNE